EKLRIEELYRWIFENSVPGLPEAAARERLSPLQYMRKYGAFLVEDQVYRTHEQALTARDLDGATVDPVTRLVQKGGQAIGVEIDGRRHVGFPTPSRKLEFFSGTLKAWKWPEQAVPNYIRSHVPWSIFEIDGRRHVGFPTPSRKLEFFSGTLKAWKWPEQAVPNYIRSHVHWSNL